METEIIKVELAKKKWWQSKTIWIGVLTIASGIAMVFESYYPTLGAIVIAKGILDVVVRFLSSQPVAITE